ncbi:3-oxoacyl-(acyl-carrier-protein) synthase III [Synechococcus sp. PCC 7335]|uniref:beta-ketoacyl-ACP synthase III n=1 Tax=Synechococcus sp. (strain ATCC 29403 / PCC 7335) TaxID=91464 RepID=UPI00017ED596|nr:beta-ketoacyl-ACP synthase III [Synechococcus sp. PCC 7335]EDX86846.1 3-oxoacyl-(acyl-carrier-protein) synthase III [Synechococcus sp. PCC 7335]
MTQQTYGVAFVGSGSAQLEAVLTNDQLAQVVDTSDEWIATRTGIRQRHIANEGESIRSLAAEAVASAIAQANLEPTDIDLILLATSTPDDLFGSACQIQAEVGATRAVAFDITAACSGFVFALVTAAQFIRAGAYQNVVVVGADILSRLTDWSDRRTCVLFGDGAGAIVMQRCSEDRLLSFEMHSDGSQNDCLTAHYQKASKPLVDDITIQTGQYHPVTMNGREVYRFAVKRVPEVLEKSLFHAGLSTDDIDWLILHQANQRILDAAAQRLGIPGDRVVSNMARHGNTDAASIPIALDEWVRKGKIKAGDTLALSGFGAGLSWGAAILKWGSVENK